MYQGTNRVDTSPYFILNSIMSQLPENETQYPGYIFPMRYTIRDEPSVHFPRVLHGCSGLHEPAYTTVFRAPAIIHAIHNHTIHTILTVKPSPPVEITIIGDDSQSPGPFHGNPVTTTPLR